MRTRNSSPASTTAAATPTTDLTFFVPGVAKPAGSKRAFMPKGGKFPVIVDDSGKPGKDWRADVKAFAIAFMGARPPLQGALRVTLHFTMPRPQHHLKKDGTPKDTAPHWHISTPDALKLGRGVEDALTGIVWVDDKQIADEHLSKVYGTRPGCVIRVSLLESQRGNNSPHPDLFVPVV